MKQTFVFLILILVNCMVHAGTWTYKEEKNIKFAQYITDSPDILIITLLQNKNTRVDKLSKDEVEIYLTLPNNSDCSTHTDPYVKSLKGNDNLLCKIYISTSKGDFRDETLYFHHEDESVGLAFRLSSTYSAVLNKKIIADFLEIKKQLIFQIPFVNIGYKTVAIDFTAPMKNNFFNTSK